MYKIYVRAFSAIVGPETFLGWYVANNEPAASA